MNKINVAILGATGAVGQRFVQLLDNHPWFTVTALTGSDRTVGRPYAEGCRWVLPGSIPAYAREMVVQPTAPGFQAQIAFSALPTDQAREAELTLAAAGYAVCSNASAYRMEADVPLLIPEVNADHTALIERQQRERGWRGLLVCNPNCTSTGVTTALAALHHAFGVQRGFMVSMQAISGAGYPGVAALDIVDNVVPYIGGEEEKFETEPRKMLGAYREGRVDFLPAVFSAHTNRVPVLDGHLVCLSLELGRAVESAEAVHALRAFQGHAVARGLPSSPANLIEVRDEPDRPQPRRDRDAGHGMTTVVGRVRPDPIWHLRLVVLSHNTLRGAAGGAILNAELLVQQGWVKPL